MADWKLAARENNDNMILCPFEAENDGSALRFDRIVFFL
jgi:hypothetical protein